MKYIRKYRGPDGKWVYVYKPMGGRHREQYAEQMKQVNAYNKQRVATYSGKFDVKGASTEALIQEYVEAGNDFDRFTTIAKTEKGKMLQFKAQNRQEQVRNELERRGDYMKLTDHLTKNPMRKSVIKFTPIEARALLETYEDMEKAKRGALEKKHIKPSGQFKGGKGDRFKNCVAYQQEKKGISKESATKLCAFIGRKAGKIP